MTAEKLASEIKVVLSGTGRSWYVGAAAITDFLRELHELMFKSSRDQVGLLAQVQAVFGHTTMCHLAKALDAPSLGDRRYARADEAPLYERVALICRQRGFEPGDGQHP